jgi:hypothetical protein
VGSNETSNGHRGSAKRVRGRPWPKGTSGNAGGGNGLRKLRAALFADMAGLRPKDRALLEQAVAMLWKARRTESAETMVRLSNSAMKILARLEQRRPQPPELTTRERVIAAVAALERQA